MELTPQRFPCIRNGQPDTYSWQPPNVADDATTEDLALIHRSFWGWIENEVPGASVELNNRPALPDQTLTRLLRLAFLASLTMDEQRPTVGNLYVPAQREPGIIKALDLEPWEPLNNQRSIARLCATLISPDAAIIVAADQGGLVATGIGSLDDQNAAYELLKYPRDWTERRGGILVSIVSPGEIRLRQGYCDYTLRGNRIVGRTPIESIEPVATWLGELQQGMLFRLPNSVSNHERLLLTEHGTFLFSIILSRMLKAATQLHHGGTFAVLQNPAGAPLSSIRFKSTENRLHEEIDHFYRAWAEAIDSEDSPGGTAKLTRFEKKRHSLLTQARARGGLTAADGCVVLDRKLRLHGFGGIIDAEKARDHGGLMFADLAEEEFLRGHGTRHRAAFYLCKACPNSLVFVISQDGDLRLFASDDTVVRFFDNLSP